LGIAERIYDELAELHRTTQRVIESWNRSEDSEDDLYLDAAALNLHSFYSGLERLFELIATSIDQFLPQGANWHSALLEQMSHEVSTIRPAVISDATCNALQPYRGFRHVVRHVYSFRFDSKKLRTLVEEMPAVFAQIQLELQAFADFLKQETE
jgi:hypothetical protein